MTQRIGLTQLPRKIADHTGHPAPAYRRLWDAAVGGKFPAEFVGNRWTVDTGDLDAIAAGLGMTVKPLPDKPAHKGAAAAVSATTAT